MSERTIQALNHRTSPSHKAYRVSVWGGSESIPGVAISWVIYGTTVPAVLARAARAFRVGPAKNRRFTDWTLNVEPLRGDERVIPAEGDPRRIAKRGFALRERVNG